MLLRTKIRQDIITLLNASAIVGTNYYDSPPSALTESDLPAVVITTPVQNGVMKAVAPPIFTNTLTIQLTCLVATAGDYAATLDDLCEQVASVVFTDADFVTNFDELTSHNTVISFDDESEKLYAVGEVTITGIYDEEYQPVLPDELSTANVDIDVDGDSTVDKTITLNL